MRVIGGIGWFVVGAVSWLLCAALGCVTRTQICVNADHARPSPDFMRSNSVGASVCVDVEKP